MQTTEDLLDQPTTTVDAPPPRHSDPASAPGLARIVVAFSPAWVCMYLGIFALVLAFCHVVTVVWHYEIGRLPWAFRGLFDLDEEESFGTWFSSGLLLMAGLASMVCALRAASLRQPRRYHWWFLGFGFCLLSCDEIAGLHESVNTVTKFSWAIPGGILAVVVGLAYLPFLFRIERRTAILSVIGGVLYLGGAVGVELATEVYKERDELDTLEYNLTTALEEWMEMTGVILFLYAVLRSLARKGKIGLNLDVAASSSCDGTTD